MGREPGSDLQTRGTGCPSPRWRAEPAVGRTTTARGGAAIRREEGPIQGSEREEVRLGTGSDATNVVREMRAARHLPQQRTPVGEDAPRTWE